MNKPINKKKQVGAKNTMSLEVIEKLYSEDAEATELPFFFVSHHLPKDVIVHFLKFLTQPQLFTARLAEQREENNESEMFRMLENSRKRADDDYNEIVSLRRQTRKILEGIS